MTLEDLLARIPYVVWHDIRVREQAPGQVKLSLGGREEVANYVGTMHAGALYTLAETAAGVVANDIIADNVAYVLLREGGVRYPRRAEGEVIATAKVDTSVANQVRAQFAAQSRADVEVSVTIDNAGGGTVFVGTFNYALRPRKP